jgi:hypothetical protein
VTVTTDPVDATIALDDDPMDAPQQQPRTVAVGTGEKVRLRIERRGYRTKRELVDFADVDPASPRRVVRLEHEAREAPPPVHPTQVRKPAAAATAVATPAPVPVAPAATPPPATAAPPPPAAPTTRPSWCQPDEWDPFEHKCTKRH